MIDISREGAEKRFAQMDMHEISQIANKVRARAGDRQTDRHSCKPTI